MAVRVEVYMGFHPSWMLWDGAILLLRGLFLSGGAILQPKGLNSSSVGYIPWLFGLGLFFRRHAGCRYIEVLC